MTKGDYRGLFDLAGRTAIVSGACGILGPRFCAGLADHGAKIAAVDLDREMAEELAARLRSDYGVEALGLACDVSDPAAVEAMAAEVTETLGEIRILVNNAAKKPSDLEAFFAPLEDYSLETWRDVMSVNLDGQFLAAQAVGRHMTRQGHGGSIIQTASVYGMVAPDQRIYEGSEYLGRPINTPPVYAASKAGVIGLTRYLAALWAERGIRVNTLTPGGVASGQNETFKARYSARVPLGRMADPDELVGAVVYLASDASSYVTGQNIVVDGGLTAW